MKPLLTAGLLALCVGCGKRDTSIESRLQKLEANMDGVKWETEVHHRWIDKLAGRLGVTNSEPDTTNTTSERKP